MKDMHARVSGKPPSESSDEVGLIIALLVRYPEIAALVSHPADGTLVLSFAVRQRFDREAERLIRERVVGHVEALLQVGGEQSDMLAVACEFDRITFVHVTRDARTFSRDELQLLTALFAETYGERLVKNANIEDGNDDDVAAQDELVEYAVESLRDPSQQKSLVGFREEKRVLVYFMSTRKKPKARARS
jgi:hypothetical protein